MGSKVDSLSAALLRAELRVARVVGAVATLAVASSAARFL
jgi:hypothetical protein